MLLPLLAEQDKRKKIIDRKQKEDKRVSKVRVDLYKRIKEVRVTTSL